MINKAFTALVVYFFLSLNIYASQEVKVLGNQSIEDVSYPYYYSLISTALKHSEDKFASSTLKTININSSAHGRNMLLLSNKTIDLYWAGTNIQREQDFIPIRVPMVRGLLGYRVLMIHKQNLNTFKSLSSQPTKLKSLVACQGMHWPDSDILEDNGYNVNRVARFDLMFKMLAKKRCDYFPRGIVEGYGELASVKNTFPELTIFDDLILYYKFPIYVFVHKNNKNLADQLTYGFNKIVKNGKLNSLLQQHPLTRDLYPLSKWRKKQIVPLDNQYLSPNTPTNSRFWINLNPTKPIN